MQALIDFLIRNLLALWPLARIYSWQQGLRVRCGIVREELDAGIHWRWWFIDEVKTWPITTIAADLDTAAVTTRDEIAVAISANLAYRVSSVRRVFLGSWNTEIALKQIALGIIASYCASRSWSELTTNRRQIEAHLVDELNSRVGTDWGLLIERVHLTDLVRARPHRHYVDGMRGQA